MEILKGIHFDLQLFAFTDTDDGAKNLKISIEKEGVSGKSVTYYLGLDGTKYTVEQTYTGASANVVSVNIASNGAYSLEYGIISTSGGVLTYQKSGTSSTVASVTIVDNLGTASYSFTASAAGAITGSTSGVTMTSSEGGSIESNNEKYTAASGKTATVTFGTAGANTSNSLTDGSVLLKSGESSGGIGVKGKEFVVSGSTDGFVVSSDGVISGLTAGTSLSIGAAIADMHTSGQVTYTVGQYTVGTSAMATGGASANATYLLTASLPNLTITMDGSTTGAEVDTFNYAEVATVLDLAVGTAGTSGTLGIDKSGTASYVYDKSGTIIFTGYQDDTIGDEIGKITSDGSTNFMYDGSGAKSKLTLADAGTANTKQLASVVGSAYDDSLNFTNITKKIYIDGGNGVDNVTFKAIEGSSVLGGAGNDVITAASAVANSEAVFIDGGDGTDNIVVDGSVNKANKWSVIGGAGNDTISIGAHTSAATEWVIGGGDGNDTINVGDGVTYSSILGGDGDDTISSFADGTNTITGGAGNDVFDISANGSVANISDYTFGEDSLKVTAADETTLIANVNKIATVAGGLTNSGALVYGVAGSSGVATISSSSNYYAATFVDTATSKDKVNVAWVKEDSASIDASSLATKTVLVGTTNNEGDLLVGGSKNDTIYAGASDSVYGGAGADNISIKAGEYGVYVGVASGSGADEVTGFTAGFNIEKADAVYLVDGTVEDATFTNGGGATVTVKSGKGSLVLNGLTAGTQKLLVGDKKVYSIAKSATLALSDSEDFADYFYGTEGSAISLANYGDDISVDLSTSMFKNISTLTGGKGNSTLIGSSKGDSLVGGSGATSLYGGAGKDTLKSGTGSTTFFITEGAGKDTVQGFVTGTTEDKSDVLNIFNAGIKSITRSEAGSFKIKVSDADVLQVAQATSGVDQMIQWQSGDAKGVAKIGMNSSANKFTYDSDVTNYLGGSKNDTVSFSGSEDVTLWLDQQTAYSSIETFDASGVKADVLIAGTAASETIKGGTGDNSLWGGVGNSKDVIIGSSSGTNIFFYGMGNGSDSISGSSKDTVNMFDIQLSDLTGADIDTSNRRVIVTTTAGDKVTVSGGVQDFVVGGVTYTTKYSSSSDWSVKE